MVLGFLIMYVGSTFLLLGHIQLLIEKAFAEIEDGEGLGTNGLLRVGYTQSVLLLLNAVQVVGFPAIVEHIHRNAVILGDLQAILFPPAQLAGGQGQVLLNGLGELPIEGLNLRDILVPALVDC